MSYLKDNFLTVEEVAKILRLSVLTIYKYIRDQKLQALVFGGHYRIEKYQLDKFIKNHRFGKNYD